MAVIPQGGYSFFYFVPKWYLNTKVELVERGKGDYLPKASIQNAVLVGICEFWRGWDSRVVCRGALPFISSGKDVRVIVNIVHIVLVTFPFLRCNILQAKRVASLNHFVHNLDREVDMDMVNGQVCLAQI